MACCQALVAAKRCRPHNELQRRKGPTKTGTVPHPDLDKPNGCRTMPDIEDFVAIAEGEGLCPFHWARDIQHTAEVLLLPYNFLADATTRRALGLNVGDDVVIFDEARHTQRLAQSGVHLACPRAAVRCWWTRRFLRGKAVFLAITASLPIPLSL